MAYSLSLGLSLNIPLNASVNRGGKNIDKKNHVILRIHQFQKQSGSSLTLSQLFKFGARNCLSSNSINCHIQAIQEN